MIAAPPQQPLTGLTLVLGGARSGKSAFAESLVRAAGGGIYLATAEALDEEMAARIAAHQARRGAQWRLIEEPIFIAQRLAELSAQGTHGPVLIDCLTLWLSNILLAERDVEGDIERLCTRLEESDLITVLVAGEVGAGTVPDNALARSFRDQAGLLNQKIAGLASAVYLLTAGIAQKLK